MNVDESMVCSECNGTHFAAKREATYVYSYKLNTTDTEAKNNETEALPYLFDNREIKNSKEYLECEKCGARYPCSFEKDDRGIELIILQKAIRSDHVTEPEFLG